MEIERKFLIPHLPQGYETHPFRQIEQAYLCTDPVVRIRREDSSCYLTYKGRGLLSREEYNLPLTPEAYSHLLPKADGIVLTKKRYLIPVKDHEELVIEMDIFEGDYEGLVLAEVEFSTEKDAMAFTPPAWFGEDVTFTRDYQNSALSQGTAGVAPKTRAAADR